jgi:hypothetical protein
VEENTNNEQQLELDQEQLQDVTGGFQASPGMSRRTVRPATNIVQGNNFELPAGMAGKYGITPGMSQRTKMDTQQPSGSNASYERAMRAANFHLANGNHESANFFLDVAKTYQGR